MPILYTAAKDGRIAYRLDGGGEDIARLHDCIAEMEAEYMAVIFGLSEYYNKWNRELDARQFDTQLIDGKAETFKVASPAAETKRQLPPAVEVRLSSELLVKMVNSNAVIWNNANCMRLAKQVSSMVKNVRVRFIYCSNADNLARRLL
jgi:hypothetical protein